MKRRNIIFLISSLLAVSLSLSYWIEPLTVEPQPLARPSTADYFFKQVSMKQFDQTGELINRLDAAQLEHFVAQDSASLLLPEISFRSKQQKDWLISAKKGIVNLDNELVVLDDEVSLESVAPLADQKTGSASGQQTESEKLSIIGSQLSFNLSDNSASSNRKILIKTSTHVTTANAMNAHFDLAQFELLGDVVTREISDD